MYWDSKFIYLSQRLVTLNDNIAKAAGYVRIGCVKFDGNDTIKKLFPSAVKPEMPPDLKIWSEACDVSSDMMKKEK